MLFHVFGHIEPDERFDRFKHLAGKALDQLRLADTGRADEDKRNRVLFDLNADAGAADGGHDGGNRLVLPNNMLFEFCVEVQKLLVFLRADLAGGDLRPELDDAGQIVDGQRGLRQLFQLRDLGIELQVAAAQLRHAGVIVLRLFGVLREHGKLQIIIGALFFERFEPADVLILEVHVRACLVDEVNGLIRQETVSDIALGEQDGLPRNLRGDHNAVERLIIMADAADDGNGLFNGWLGDGDGLEAALKRGVLFDVFAVLVEGRRADDLDLAARKRGLEDIGGVHGSLCIACADEIMHLVNDQNNIAEFFDLFNEALHTAFKLPPELRARDEGREVHEIDLLVLELIRNVLVGDLLRKALGDGSLADARLADEAGVILLAAVEDLNDALRLLLAADDAVKLAVTRFLRQILAVGVEEFVLFVLGVRLVTGALAALGFFRLRDGRRVVLPLTGGAKELVEEGERGGLAVSLVVLAAVLRVMALTEQALKAVHGLGHFAVEIFEVIL